MAMTNDDDRDSLLSSTTAPLLQDDNISDPLEIPEAKGHWVWFLTLSAGISGLLFGYDTASISSALLLLGPSLSTPEHLVTTWDKSLITSGTSFGALFGGLVAGVLADRWGRRTVIWLADFLFLVGALWQALSHSVFSMILGRVVVGLGVGVGSLIVPLYISELAPASRRGRLVVVSILFVTFGQLVAYTIGLLLSPPRLSPDTSWRWILGLGAAPAIFQAFLMIAMPETPRWQLLHSRHEDAQRTISQVYGTADAKTIAHLLAEIQSGIPSGPHLSLLPTLKSLLITPSHRRALTIACFLQFLQQACGFNSLMYFSASLFSMLGFHSPTGVALVVAGTNAVSTLFAFHLIDRIGRRQMLLYSLTFMTISLTVCAGVFLVLPPLLPSSITPPSQTAAPLAAVFMVTAMTTFVASYAVGLGPIPWLCQSEFFAIEVRGVGTGAATATNWFWNLIISATFLPLLEAVGGAGAFTVYAVVCAGGLTVGWRVYPETGGLGMERIQEVLAHGWGV